MSDAGGEYKSKEFDELLTSNGILTRQSVAHTPQQNGRAEQFNRTIMDKAEAMRHHTCLSNSWWEFSVEYAVHIYNRTPIRRLKWKTPFETLYKKAPDVTHLRVLGCGAYVYLPDAVRNNKLHPKAELMIFIGFTDGIKGYKFMCIHNNSIFHGTKALFDEDLLPKCPKANQPKDKTHGDLSGDDDDQPDHGIGPTGDGGPPPSGPDDDDNNNDHPHHDEPPCSPSPNEDGPEDDQPRDRSPSPVGPQIDLERMNFNPRREDNEEFRRLPRHNPPRLKKKYQRPDNLYRGPEDTRLPSEIQRDVERDRTWRRQVGDKEPGSSKLPTRMSRRRTHPPSNQDPKSSIPKEEFPPSNPNVDKDWDMSGSDANLTRITQEGGVSLMNFLLSKAVEDSKTEIGSTSNLMTNSSDPKPDNVREWTYHDIMRLPPDQRKPWIDACHEELKSLRERQVFSLA